MEIKNGKRQEDDPKDSIVIMLPILAMGVLIGIVALLMRSAGKW